MIDPVAALDVVVTKKSGWFPGRPKHFVISAHNSQSDQLGHIDVMSHRGAAEVSFTYVDPSARRQGVATALYRRLYEWADEQGLRVEHSYLTQDGAATVAALRERGLIPSSALIDNPKRDADRLRALARRLAQGG